MFPLSSSSLILRRQKKRCTASKYQLEKSPSLQITAKVNGLGLMPTRGLFTPLKQKHVSYHLSWNSLDCLYRFIISLSFMPNLCKIKGNWHKLLFRFPQSLKGNTVKVKSKGLKKICSTISPIKWLNLFFYWETLCMRTLSQLKYFSAQGK